MIYPVPDSFQRTLDDYNDSVGGTARIELCWHPEKERWQIFAVVVGGNSHPDHRPDDVKKLYKAFPDGSGRYGVLLFTWCDRNARGDDIGYLPLDQRVIDALVYCDTRRDKHHFDNTFTAAEDAKDLDEKKRIRAIAGAGAEYYKGYDNLSISMNPTTKAGGSWRHRIR